MPIVKNIFWEDLQEDLKDSKRMESFITESVRISAFDEAMNKKG